MKRYRRTKRHNIVPVTSDRHVITTADMFKLSNTSNKFPRRAIRLNGDVSFIEVTEG